MGCRGRAAREGQHITLVDTITDTHSFPMKKNPRRKCLRITVGSGRSKVTATFFNADYLSKDLTEGTRVMLSGEVGYFKNVMQLTHPDFLILDSPGRTQPRQQVAQDHRRRLDAVSGEELMSAFERRFFPIYPASTKLQSWDIYRLRAPGARGPRSGGRSAARRAARRPST